MQTLTEVLQWVQRFAFTALALVSLRLAIRHRGVATTWAAAAFCSFDLIVIAAAFAGRDPEALPLWFVKVLVAVILVFPYFLFRFMAAFAPPPRWGERLAVGLTGIVIGWTLLLPAFPPPGTPRTPMVAALAFGVIIQWTVLSLWVSIRLWTAGRGQPTLPRRRLRLLAAAAFGLNVSVVVSGAAGATPSAAVLLAQQALGVFGTALFFIALSPPALLRSWWRRPEERSLREAAVGVSAASTLGEVAEALLPAIAPMFGGAGALLAGDGRQIHGRYGIEVAEAVRIVDDLSPEAGLHAEPNLLTLRLRSGWLAVKTSPYSPLFGSEEASLLQGIGLFVDLAMERAERFETDRRLVSQLQNTLDIRSRLVSSVSHELRTPLTSILGFSETLTEHWTALDDESRRTFIGKISEHAEELRELVDGLLDYASVEAGRVTRDLERIDLRGVVESTLDSLAPVLTGRPVEVDLDEPATVVRTNPVLLRRTLNNLLTNAVKYSPAGTPISIRALARGTTCRVEVVDRGSGLTRDEADRAFEPFWRGRDSSRVRGAGIGLSLVREYSRLMGGDVGVESTPGEGSTFFFTLPMAHAERTEAAIAG